MTRIEWTDETWNPTVGCERCSPGCDHCYAIRVAAREMQPAHAGLTHTAITTAATQGASGVARKDWTGEVRLLPERLDQPLRWRKPRRVFVDSMSDLFHPDVPEPFLNRVFRTMRMAQQHTFQVLTKRPQRMASYLAALTDRSHHYPLSNAWLGTSVETQRYADLRIPHLLATPAAVRWLSIEPLLGPVDLTPWLRRISDEAREASPYEWDTSHRIDWVVVGGESGRGARPMEREWAQDIVEQCRHWGVPVFVKQLGTVLGGKNHHDIETFPAGLQVREYPT